MSALLDSSLIVPLGSDQSRFTMLETVRQYAEEHLARDGCLEAARRHHADHFLALAEEAAAGLIGPDQESWLRRLDTEHDNLRAVLHRSLQCGDIGTIARVVGALWRFWYLHGHFHEGRSWLKTALTGGASGPERATCLYGLGVLIYLQGDDIDNAEVLFEEALDLARSAGNSYLMTASLNTLGMIAQTRGDHPLASARYTEALRVSRAEGDVRLAGVSLTNLATLAKEEGRLDDAATAFTESIELFRQLGDHRSVADNLNGLGGVALAGSDYQRAAQLCTESLAVFRRLDDRTGCAEASVNLGMVFLHLGDDVKAAELLDEALTRSEELDERWCQASALNGLGRLALRGGDLHTAEALCWRSFDLHRDLAYPAGAAASMLGLAEVALASGQDERAARLIGAAARVREEGKALLPPAERSEWEARGTALRQTLGPAAFDAAVAAGMSSTTEELMGMRP